MPGSRRGSACSQWAAGAVGQALLVLGRMAGVRLGTARGEHASMVRELGATPIDYRREDFTRPAGRVRRRLRRRRRRRISPLVGGAQARRPALCLGLLGGCRRDKACSRLLGPSRDSICRGSCRAASARFYMITGMRDRHPDWFPGRSGAALRSVGQRRHPAARSRADLVRSGRRGAPTARGGRSRGEARALPGA